MFSAPLTTLDEWCRHAAVATTFWSWFVGVAIVAPIAAWATLAVVHGFGGRALTAPRCLACGHFNVAGASARCTECGHELSDGTAWTRRKPRWRDAVRGLALGAGLVALGIAFGGIAFAVLTSQTYAVDPWARIRETPFDELLRRGTPSDIGLRLGFEQSSARTPEERRRLADAVRRAIADAPDAAKRLGDNPALEQVVNILERALRDGNATEGEVLSSLALIGATPRILIPRLVPAASVVPIVASRHDRVYARVRNVETIVDDLDWTVGSRNAHASLFVSPAGVRRVVVVVTWEIAIAQSDVLAEPRMLSRLTSVFDCIATPGAPRLGVAATPRERVGDDPVAPVRANVEGATFQKIGTQVLVHVSLRPEDRPGMVGRFTATLHHVDGDAARDVSVHLIGALHRPDLAGLLPPGGTGVSAWPPPFDSMTLSFEPDLRTADQGQWYDSNWYPFEFVVASPWRSDRVPIAPPPRAE